MSEQLKSGAEWLGELQGALGKVVTFMALSRYGAVPDVADRVSDALTALVEGAHRFVPQPGKDGIGYFLQYVLSYVSGALRNGAQTAKDWSEEAVCFTDVTPEVWGIEAVWEQTPGSPAEEPEETHFVTKSGKVATKMELVEMATDTERGPKVAKLLGVQTDNSRFRVLVLRALDTIEEGLNADPRWIDEVPDPEPVVTHDLDDVTVTRNGVQSVITGAEMRQMVDEASRGGAMWHVSEGEDDETYETDSPWPTWVAADGTRSYRSPYADDNTWPTSVSRKVWLNAVGSWQTVGWAEDVLDALEGYSVPEDGVEVCVKQMEALAELLADEPEGCTRTVCRALAHRLNALDFAVEREDGQDPADALFERLCWSLGVDGTGEWEAPLATADGMRHGVQGWVEKAAAHKGVWPSQVAAIKALVLHGASPQEARQAAQAAFSARQA